MKAVVFHGRHDVRTEEVPDPKLIEKTDCILKITKTALCGSDLHLYNGLNPDMKKGDILGHEFMGEVVEVGDEVRRIKVGDRVIVPFAIVDGACRQCRRGFGSACENSNPANDKLILERGYGAAALYGYSHMYGGFAGGQAQYVRVLLADANLFKVPEGMSDEQALFTTDIFPTGYMAAENANIPRGGTVAILGGGPVGQFAAKSAFLLGAGRVIVIDSIPERLALAQQQGCEVINYVKEDVLESVKLMTSEGPDAVIDAVGMESHSASAVADALAEDQQMLRIRNKDTNFALKDLIKIARPCTSVSIPGVYMGELPFPMGMAFGKGLRFAMGQTNVHQYVDKLFNFIADGAVDPTFLITHRLSLEDAADAYKMFNDKSDGCIKVVFTP